MDNVLIQTLIDVWALDKGAGRNAGANKRQSSDLQITTVLVKDYALKRRGAFTETVILD
jgi:hypothetical protein